MALSPISPTMRHPNNRQDHEMPSLFDLFQRDMRYWLNHVFRDYPMSSHSDRTNFAPAIDIREDDKNLDISADLPGVDEKDIHVTIENDCLVIRGERKSEREEKKEGQYCLTERHYGSFLRTIPLPYQIDPAKITARFDQGVLKICLQKPAEMLKKQVKIPVSH